jgi:hypothetical protein
MPLNCNGNFLKDWSWHDIGVAALLQPATGRTLQVGKPGRL